uniref:Uncharacterized protein LOC101511067 n=1 Tax=Cicer arietinum TaxID=3827 RepID=A0A1S2XER1_CICAR|nr:uncharacterized protein LOC101511067 [Cicer arietinum]
MENINHSHHFIIITFITLTMFTTFTQCTIPTTTTLTTNTTLAMQEINNILDALIGSTDTSINQWANILSMTNSTNPLLTLTLFIPQNQQSSQPPSSSILDPFTFPYHIIPQRLTFSDLLLLPRYSRLPTLLPGKTIAVTDNSSANFTLDDVEVTHPDLYSTSYLAVHGVKTILDYSTFGDATMMPTLPPFLPVGETWKSASSSSATTFKLFLLVLCFILPQLVFFV